MNLAPPLQSYTALSRKRGKNMIHNYGSQIANIIDFIKAPHEELTPTNFKKEVDRKIDSLFRGIQTDKTVPQELREKVKTMFGPESRKISSEEFMRNKERIIEALNDIRQSCETLRVRSSPAAPAAPAASPASATQAAPTRQAAPAASAAPAGQAAPTTQKAGSSPPKSPGTKFEDLPTVLLNMIGEVSDVPYLRQIFTEEQVPTLPSSQLPDQLIAFQTFIKNNQDQASRQLLDYIRKNPDTDVKPVIQAMADMGFDLKQFLPHFILGKFTDIQEGPNGEALIEEWEGRTREVPADSIWTNEVLIIDDDNGNNRFRIGPNIHECQQLVNFMLDKAQELPKESGMKSDLSEKDLERARKLLIVAARINPTLVPCIMKFSDTYEMRPIQLAEFFQAANRNILRNMDDENIFLNIDNALHRLTEAPDSKLKEDSLRLFRTLISSRSIIQTYVPQMDSWIEALKNRNRNFRLDDISVIDRLLTGMEEDRSLPATLQEKIKTTRELLKEISTNEDKVTVIGLNTGIIIDREPVMKALQEIREACQSLHPSRSEAAPRAGAAAPPATPRAAGPAAPPPHG